MRRTAKDAAARTLPQVGAYFARVLSGGATSTLLVCAKGTKNA